MDTIGRPRYEGSIESALLQTRDWGRLRTVGWMNPSLVAKLRVLTSGYSDSIENEEIFHRVGRPTETVFEVHVFSFAS